MRRKLLLGVLAGILLLTMVPLAASEEAAAPAPKAPPGPFAAMGAPGIDMAAIAENPPDPTSRATAWLPEDPGTKKTITIAYGPYTVHPGSDLTRLDFEIPQVDGYAYGFYPRVLYADSGEEAPSHVVHTHHAHWMWIDPDAPGEHRWFYGTGEEKTQGSIMPAAKAHPDYKKGLRYGVPLKAGDRLMFLSMLHNKTADALTLYLEINIEFTYGTQAQLAEQGLEFHDLTPVLIGTNYQVPRSDGLHIWPRDITKDETGYGTYTSPVDTTKIVPGVGYTWTSPWNGVAVIGAGHSHPGAKEVIVSNLGTKNDPCPEDGDGIPGMTAAHSTNFTRGGAFPSEEFQMGLTQPGWRLHIRKGDRISINGIYDSSEFAFPDAMSYFGFYVDQSAKPSPCKVELVDRPKASRSEVLSTTLNRKWEHHAMPTCTKCNDTEAPLPEPGPETNIIHIAGHTYFPGNLGSEGPVLGPPVIKKGETLTVINEDYAGAAVRHTVTTCKAPCNGEYVANYPWHDGVLDSGALGEMYQDGYQTTRTEPRWEFDTSNLDAGYYAYYCRLHAWMRGSFYIEE